MLKKIALIAIGTAIITAIYTAGFALLPVCEDHHLASPETGEPAWPGCGHYTRR